MPSLLQSLQTDPIYRATIPPVLNSPTRQTRRTSQTTLHPSPLRRPAAVVGNRRYILDRYDFKTGCLNGPDGRLSAGARTFDIDLDLPHAVLHGLLRSGFSSKLRGEGSAFP